MGRFLKILALSIVWLNFWCVSITAGASSSSSLEYEVGQMIMVGFKGTTLNDDSLIVQQMKKYHIGGVVLADHFTDDDTHQVHPRNIISPQQLKHLTQQLQAYAKKYNIYPLLIAVDQEGGNITALKPEKGFALPFNYTQLQLGAKNNRHLMFKQARETGKLLHEYGINVNFAPVAALNVNPSNPVIALLGRTFGKNPSRVSKDILVTMEGYQAAGIACTLKHFPGMGSATHNTDYKSYVDVSQTWSPRELWPYEAAISSRATCPLIMVSHVINQQIDERPVPASLSPKVVTHLLRDRLKYQGIVITDDIDAPAIRQILPLKEAVTLAVDAGDNIILYNGNHESNVMTDVDDIYHAILTSAQDDLACREKVHVSYLKIKSLKADYIIN